MAAPLRLAIVGWATDTGVGREFTDAARHLPIVGAFALPHVRHPTRRDLLPPGAFAPPAVGDFRNDMKRFLDEVKPDAVLTWEVPGSWEFPEIWRAAGVRWWNVVHWDWFAPEAMSAWKRASLIAPNGMCQRGLAMRYGLKSVYVPVPVDTDRFPFTLRKRGDRFVTVYGQGGPGDRRSLIELSLAWRSMADAPPLFIRARRQPSELYKLPPAVALDLSDRPDPATLFDGVDVAVMPSKYEGVGLSLLEAQACGLPTVTVDAEPMNEVAPDLLVPSARAYPDTIMKDHAVTFHAVSVEGLVRKIEELRGSDISDLSCTARQRVEEKFSWKALKEVWLETLAGK